MAKENTPVVVQLAELLAKATPDDLAKIDADIAAKRAEIDSLGQLRKLIAARLGLEEPKKPHWTARKKAEKAGQPAARPAAPAATGTTAGSDGQSGAVRTRRFAIARLLGTRGPLMPSVIAEELSIDVGHLPYALKCDWFEADGKGTYKITPAGRREGLGAA